MVQFYKLGVISRLAYYVVVSQRQRARVVHVSMVYVLCTLCYFFFSGMSGVSTRGDSSSGACTLKDTQRGKETTVEGSNTRHPFCMEESSSPVHDVEIKLNVGPLQATMSDSELPNPLDMLFMSYSQLEAHDKTVMKKSEQNSARHPAALGHKEEPILSRGDEVANDDGEEEGKNDCAPESSSVNEISKEMAAASAPAQMCMKPSQPIPALTVFQYPSDTQIARRTRRRKCQRRHTSKKARVSTSSFVTRKPQRVGSVIVRVKPGIVRSLSAGRKEVTDNNAPCHPRVLGIEDYDRAEQGRCSGKDVQVASLGLTTEAKVELAPVSRAARSESSNGSLSSPPPLPQPSHTTSPSTGTSKVTPSVSSAPSLKRMRRLPGLSKSLPGKKVKMAAGSGEPASSSSVSEYFLASDESPGAFKQSPGVFEFESAALTTSTPLIGRGQTFRRTAEPARKLPVKSFKAPRKLSDVSHEEEQASVARILARFGCPTPKSTVKGSGSGAHQLLADSGFAEAGSCKVKTLDAPGGNAGLKEPTGEEHSNGLTHEQGIFTTGFSTAGSKSLTVSKTAMDRGRQLLGESAASPPGDVTAITSFDMALKQELRISLGELTKGEKGLFKGELDGHSNSTVARNDAEPARKVTNERGSPMSSEKWNSRHKSEDVTFATEFKGETSKEAKVVTGFFTASGRDILVSTSALERATGIVSGEEKTPKKAKVVTGFSTASGRDILVSTSALERATFVNEEEKTSKKAKAVTEFLTASGRDILVSTSALERTTGIVTEDEKALTKAKVVTGFSTASGRNIRVSTSALEKAAGIVTEDEKALTKAKVVTGFSTASGRNILVSTSALEKATGIVNQEEKASTKTKVLTGFATASGRNILVSTSALEKATGIVSQEEKASAKAQLSTGFVTTSGSDILVFTPGVERATGSVGEEQSLVASGGQAVVRETVFSGFTTASGQSLSVRSSSMRKAQDLVGSNLLPRKEMSDMNQVTQFSTASDEGVKVSIAVLSNAAGQFGEYCPIGSDSAGIITSSSAVCSPRNSSSHQVEEDTDSQHIPEDLDIEKFSIFTQLPSGTNFEGVHEYHEGEDKYHVESSPKIQPAADVDSSKLAIEKGKVVSKEVVPDDIDVSHCQTLPVTSEQDSFGLDGLFEFSEQMPSSNCPLSYYDQDTHTVLDPAVSEGHSEDKVCSSESGDKDQIDEGVREEVCSCDTPVSGEDELLSASIVSNLEKTGLFPVSDDSHSSGEVMHAYPNDSSTKKDSHATDGGHQSHTGPPPVIQGSPVAPEVAESKLPPANDSKVPLSLAENSTCSFYPGLATASGKGVSVSAQSLAHVRKVLHDDIPHASLSLENIVCGHSSPIHTSDATKGAHSHSLPLVGLSTASGKSVAVSEEALAYVRTQLHNAHLEQTPLGTKAGCRKGSELSEDALTDSLEEVSGDDPAARASHPIASLSTASGKAVTVSEDLLSLVKGNVAGTDCICPQASFPAPMFSTASGKAVSVSQTALEHARLKLFNEPCVYPISVGESGRTVAISATCIADSGNGNKRSSPSHALSARLAKASKESVPLCGQTMSEDSHVADVMDCLLVSKKDAVAKGKKTALFTNCQ